MVSFASPNRLRSGSDSAPPCYSRRSPHVGQLPRVRASKPRECERRSGRDNVLSDIGEAVCLNSLKGN